MVDKYQQAAIEREIKRSEELSKYWQGDIPISKRIPKIKEKDKCMNSPKKMNK